MSGQTPAAPPGWYQVPGGGTAWWDGQQWHQQAVPAAPVQPPEPYTPIKPLAAISQTLIGVVAAIEVFSIWVEMTRYRLVDKVIDDPFSVSFTELDNADDRAVFAGVLYLLALLLSGIVFLVWRHRVQRNLSRSLGVAYLEYTPGWAVGWWFVPFANLVKPKQAMNEAWTASDPDAQVGSADWKSAKAPALLSWWWAVWLISGFVGGVFSGGTGEDQTAAELQGQLVRSMFSSVLGIVAAVLCIMVVRGITARHVERARRLGAGVE